MNAGVQARLDNTAISVLIAILAHKCVEALTVSSNFIKENVQLSKAIPVIAVYCCMTPLGIAVGMTLNQYLTNETYGPNWPCVLCVVCGVVVPCRIVVC